MGSLYDVRRQVLPKSVARNTVPLPTLESFHGMSDGGMREEACEGGRSMIEIEIKSETESQFIMEPEPLLEVLR